MFLLTTYITKTKIGDMINCNIVGLKLVTETEIVNNKTFAINMPI